MRKLHGYLLAGLLALSALGGIASMLYKKDVAIVQAKDEEIDVGLKASDFITPSGYLIPTANKWVPQINETSNPYDYDNMSFKIQKGTVFSADISSENELMYQMNKLSFSFNVSVAGCVKKVKIMRFDKTPYTELSYVEYSDTTLTTYSGVLEFEVPSDWTKLKFRVDNTNTEYYISNFSMTAYKTITTANVSFNMQGHGSQVASQTVDIGNKVTQPSNPSATGYTFGGWYKEAACTNAWNFNSDTVSGDTTLYAKWTLTSYAITYNLNGGTATNPANYNVQTASFTLNNPTRTGYTFDGWSGTGISGKSKSVTIAKGSTGNRTYTANWTAISYTLTYTLDGGTATNPANYNIQSASFTLNNPTKTGYTFDGWSGTGITGKSKSVTIAKGSTGNRSYTAYWTANSYNVTFDTTYGTGGIDATTLTYDHTLPDLEASQIPTRESSSGHSYSFGGYYTEVPTENEDGSLTPHGKQYYNEFGKGIGLWKEAANTTLYAYWTIDMTVSSSSWSGTWSHEEGKPNTGVKHGITVTPVDPEDAVVWYGLSAGACNSTKAEDFLRSDAGVYEIFFEVKKDGYTTYYGSETITINKDISIIDPRPTAVSGLEYTALDQELVVAGEVDYGNMLYAVNTTGELPADSEFSATIPTGKFVGTYYVFYKSSGDGNHNPYAVVETEVITIKIARVDRTEVSNLNNTVLAYLETINERYPEIAATLEAVRLEVYQDAIVQDNITVEGVNQNIIYLQEALSAAKVDVTEALIEAIGSVSYPNSKDEIDEAKDYFDNVLSAEEQAAVNATLVETLNKDNNDYNDAKTVADLISAIPEPSDTEEYYKAVEDAKEAYNALALSNPDAYDLVNDATDKEYETILENNVEAKEVIEIIEAIGELTYNGGTDDSLVNIKSAEEAYEALALSNPDALALVNQANHDDLVEARESYDDVDETVKLIAAIGEIVHGGEDDSKKALVAAREAYDALSLEDQALVDGYKNSYKVLDDDEHVYTALEYIDGIGTVSYDSESEEKINEARKYYDSLTKDQKEQLGKEPLATLVKSETRYAGLKKTGNILVIILLIIVSLIILAGIWFLFFLLKRKKDDDEEENKNGEVKLASIGGFLPLITLASHYTDAPYLALYILSGVAIILWLSILGLVLYRKFKKPEVVGVSSEASVALPSSAQEEANAILQSIKKDEEESKLVVDKKGNIFQIRYIKSFTAKLSQSSDAVKEKYNELKNCVLSYENVSSRVSWHYDSINASKEQLIKFSIRGKTLCVYFSPKIENPGEGYKLEDAKGNRYEKVPYLLRIKSEKKFEQVKELIELLMKRIGLKKGKVLNDDYKIPYETTEVLLHKGLIKELATHLEVDKEVKKELLKSVAVEKVDELMSDDTAESLIEDDIVVHQKIGKREIINVDTLSNNFIDGDLVNLEALIAKKLVPAKTEYVKVLARGVLDKKLNVDLHDYSIQAVKMILLTGGTVKKIHE